MNQRRFHRVKCSTTGELRHNEMSYKCRLENVSLRGALISADECIMVPLGETCLFSVRFAPDTPPVEIGVTVVHCFFSMLGVEFANFRGDAELRLLDFMKTITSEPAKLMQEWEMLRAQTASGQRAEGASAAV